MKKSTRLLLTAAAISGLYVGSFASKALADDTAGKPAAKQDSKDKASCKGKDGCNGKDSCKGKHDCKGKNSCKGQGGCASGDNGCKGKNSCKGKGGCGAEMGKDGKKEG